MPEPLKPLSWYKELSEGKSRRESGCFLVEGERAIRQVAGIRPEAVTELISSIPLPPDLDRYPVRTVTEKQLRSVSTASTPQGLIAVVRLPQESYAESLPDTPGCRVLVLEDIQDPGNVGTLIRTAAAFDYDGVLLSDKSADPFSPKCVQSAAGSVLSLWLRRSFRFLEMASELKEQGFRLVAATLDGEHLPEALKQTNLALALGNEAAGLSPALLKLSNDRFRLPVAKEKAESLNVAVCGGICMYLSTWTDD